MGKRISFKVGLVVGITLALVAIWYGADTLLAQGPGRNPLGGSPTETFTYQGQLTDSGAPANGPYDFRISLYDAEAGGTQIGSSFLYNDWPVTNGIFTLNIPGGSQGSLFNGDPRWILVEVRPGASGGAYTALPRQPITATPYAWGLRPSAVVSGASYAADGWILKVNSDGTTYPTASAILATSATGYAVHGNSTSLAGLYGTTADGYGVMGIDLGATDARGYGGYFESTNGVGVYGESLATRTYTNNFAPGVYGKSSHGAGVYGFSNSTTGQGGRFVNVSLVNSTQTALWVGSYFGDIIDGYELDATQTGMPTNLRFRVTWDGNVSADGSFTGGGADVAERIDTRSTLEPGDVVEIDLNNPNGFRLSQSAYSTLVAGVVSTNPGLKLNNNDPSDQVSDQRPLLALVGQVPVKASAENGAIKPGDLLVAAATHGYAMKAGLQPAIGTVIGKALERLDAGKGTIKMLVMLR